MMMRTLAATALLLVSLVLLSMALVGCEQAADTPDEARAPATAADTVSQSEIDALVRPYLELRRLLVEDKLDGVSEQFAAIRRAAQPLTEAESAETKNAAQTLVRRTATTPEDIKQVRQAFKGISAAMIELVAATPPSDRVAETLYVAYCPMAKAHWLQTSEEVSNPYMGQEMPKCGEIQKTIKPVAA